VREEVRDEILSKGYDAERAENTCVVTTLTASIDQVDPNDVAVAFSDHWTSTPRVSVSNATAPLAITCPTPAVCAFDVVTGTPNSRRVAGSYGRPMCSIEFVVDSRGDR